MSYPESKTISKIVFSDLAYLSSSLFTEQQGGGYRSVDFSESDEFNKTTGKPLNGLTTNQNVDSFFTNVVSSSLEESTDVNNLFVFKYPGVLETDQSRDIEILNECEIRLSFVLEGASMMNSFGYYFYYKDGQGNKNLLDSYNKTQNYYYRPTIVFPHIQHDISSNSALQFGDTVKLRGNLSNGNFGNICVGFFLVPHGWFAYINNSTIGNDSILYSTLEFNVKYIDSDDALLSNRIYSVFARTEKNNQKLLLIGFEDMAESLDQDHDYNDCVVGLVASDVNQIKDYEKFAKIDTEDNEIEKEDTDEDYNNLIFVDEEGEYVSFPTELDDDKDYIFERRMKFSNSSDRDNLYDCYNDLNNNYSCKNSKNYSGNSYELVQTRLFRKLDIRKLNNEKKLYLFEAEHSRNYKLENLVKFKEIFEKVIVDPTYLEQYKLYDRDHPNNTLINLNDIYYKSRVSSKKVDWFVMGNGMMICKNGRSHLPFKNRQIYNVYFNSIGLRTLKINVEMDVHPQGYMSGTKTFLRRVGFYVDNQEHVIIDLGNLSLYREINNVLSSALASSYSKIEISNIMTTSSIKKIIKILKQDTNTSYRTVKINNHTFYCINFGNIKNNPTMIFLDSSLSIDWFESMANINGTYYYKQILYPFDHWSSDF